jgi:hypothetical protein
MKLLFTLLLSASPLCFAGCNQKQAEAPARTTPPKHEHKPPHHGTPVMLGDEEYHVELVLEPASGQFQAYVMDGELENFVRTTLDSFEVTAKLPSGEQVLKFQAVANSATGEQVGDTSLFETQADWLKTTPAFDAVLRELNVRGKTYRNVSFNFPKGNDVDEKKN